MKGRCFKRKTMGRDKFRHFVRFKLLPETIMESLAFLRVKKTEKNSKRFLIEFCDVCLLVFTFTNKTNARFTIPLKSPNSTHCTTYNV